MRILVVLPLAFCLAFILGSCKKSDSNPAGTTTVSIPASLVGTWTPQSATVDGAPTPLADVFQWEPTTVTARMTFNASGNYSYTELDANGGTTYSEAGTVSASAQNFTLTVRSANGQTLNPARQTSGQWAVSGNNLTLTLNNGGTIIVILFTK